MTLNSPLEEIELDWFAKWNTFAPDRTALKDGDSGRYFTYADCYLYSQKLAGYLANNFEVGHGDRVAVLAQNELEFVILFFALQRLGAILVPLNFRLKAKELDYILTDCQPKILLYQDLVASEVENLSPSARPAQTIKFEELSKGMETGDQLVSFHSKYDDPAMILYTSGTTGFPKGAIITNKTIFWNSLNTTMRLNITEQDRTVSFLPFFHTGGWNVLTTPFLHRGAQVTIVKKFEPELILNICNTEKVSILFGVPTTMEMMARTSQFSSQNFGSLRFAVVGGEPMPVEQIEVWENKGVPVRQGYGLTEFGPNVFSLNEEHSKSKIGSIGFPNFYIETKVVDGKDSQVGPNEVGELLLKGPSMMEGYWNNEEATRQTIKDGWLYTGDLVRFDEDGFFYVVGRKKEMYISGGENVYPAEVERVLYSIAGVREAAVVGVADDKWGEVGKAFIALEKEADLSLDAVVDHCISHLAKFKVPKYVEFLSELPKGDSGKILKRQLT